MTRSGGGGGVMVMCSCKRTIRGRAQDGPVTGPIQTETETLHDFPSTVHHHLMHIFHKFWDQTPRDLKSNMPNNTCPEKLETSAQVPEIDPPNRDLKSNMPNNTCPEKLETSAQVPEIDPPNRGTKWEKVAIAAGVVTAAAVVAPFAVVGALGAAGFGAGGVVAGSVAAGIQSAVYGGATGGIFAVCQSIGAAGLGVTGVATSALGGGGIAGGVFASLNKLLDRKNENNSGNNDSSPGSPVNATSSAEPQKFNGNVKTSSNQGQCNKSTQTEEVASENDLKVVYYTKTRNYCQTFNMSPAIRKCMLVRHEI